MKVKIETKKGSKGRLIVTLLCTDIPKTDIKTKPDNHLDIENGLPGVQNISNTSRRTNRQAQHIFRDQIYLNEGVVQTYPLPKSPIEAKQIIKRTRKAIKLWHEEVKNDK